MPPLRSLLLLAALLSSACAYARPPCCPRRPCEPVSRVVATPPETRPAPDHAFYTGTGEPLSWNAVVTGAKAADVVAFGELHGHAVGSRRQLDLLRALAEDDRPVALAMEFFERDTQADLDAYLAGALEEAEFAKRTRQGKAYATSHRALIELCKQHGIPVIAANAPRPLVTAYRKSEGDYAAYLAGLSPEERGWLPSETTTPDDPYRERFMQLMGPKRGPTYFRAQALWDDAMGAAVASFRDAHPEHRVLLIVGAFHVTGGLGTLTKFSRRRPNDTVYVVLMNAERSNEIGFADGDRGTGDAVLKVKMPPRPKPKAASGATPPARNPSPGPPAG